jgi:hypothetical protein
MLERSKLTGTDQILVELIKAGGEHHVLRSINLLIISGITKRCLSNKTNTYLDEGLKIGTSCHSGMSLILTKLHTNIYPTFFSQG